ncbi:FAD-dependent pyridine nucleotide-disulphide oxidoreductase [Hymenobacter roseosalivarius DSM 11622]|uniref:FAD-dependent pyridine nucleotide-disulphide oxidoreductase n=1 Tax=Hymenobacter roseosalivarius DSM 11622 TaxID=645990 RepID=A0A1W1W3W9_9BACT|nr:FAD-dependent oxidoreductase [Hymenobacter roseosalivarius]SMC00332.1 FAD-dependent pyridine nucleotide-disulphide oxidoreductase [Hymenobacter roseosalivarius DSM 11622]
MHLVIIGNGITGVTAAQTVRRLAPAARITLVSEESEHHYSRTALMYVYMGHLRYQDVKPYEDWFWAENHLELIHATATALDAGQRQLRLSNGQTLGYDKLLLATGSVSRRFGWPGQDLRGVQGLYGLPDLAQMERDTQGISRGVVVGGGLIGVELAEMLHTRHIAATVLVRDQHYWGSVLPPEEAELVDQQFRAHDVDVRYRTELREILGDSSGRVRAIVTSQGEEIACQWVGLGIGVTPNLSLAQDSAVETDRGILVDELLQTNQPDVYAAGDCAQHRQPGAGEVAIEQLWYTGRMQGETVAHTICGRPTPYRRGVWFNSAKFFNLEYQTYGQVPARPPADVESFYWQHPTGSCALRINFAPQTGNAVLGFNAMGLRLRQAVCESWIKAKTPIQTVIQQLKTANFDPEFYRRHERAIQRQFAEMSVVKRY